MTALTQATELQAALERECSDEEERNLQASMKCGDFGRSVARWLSGNVAN